MHAPAALIAQCVAETQRQRAMGERDAEVKPEAAKSQRDISRYRERAREREREPERDRDRDAEREREPEPELAGGGGGLGGLWGVKMRRPHLAMRSGKMGRGWRWVGRRVGGACLLAACR